MPFTLDQIIPWGRTLGEYLRMFAFDDRDLTRSLLGVGDGPAAFNATLSRWGGRVVSADPLYQYSRNEIGGRIGDIYDQVLGELGRNLDAYVWREYASPEALGRTRLRAMEEFLQDFEAGRGQGRYLPAALPALPFADGSFDIALCSHLLFTYSQQLDAEFHRAAVTELCRVAPDVRIFPLLDLGGERSPFVEVAMEAAHAAGCEAAVRRVEYEFQRGGNELLQLRRRV